MKCFIVIALMIIATRHSTHGKPVVTEYMNGTDTSFDRDQRLKYPWFAQLPVDCGGTLITPRHVLTAAHCVVNHPNEMKQKFDHGGNYSLLLKSVDRCVSSHFVEKFRIANVTIHPEYYSSPESELYINDIAIITLDKEATGIQPVALPADGSRTVHESNALIMGFGEAKKRVASANLTGLVCHLRTAHVDIFTSTECNLQTNVSFHVKLALYLGESLICAGRLEGGVASCHGDNGGPLLVERNGRYVLRGVVSNGKGCGQPKHPGIYTNVAHFLPWIKQHAPQIKQERVDNYQEEVSNVPRRYRE